MEDNLNINERLLRDIPVESLHFDPQNPRLPSSVDGNNDMDVIEWMLRDATLIELMGAIGEVGFFPGEPLLVTHDNSGRPYHFIVVEGNRRLAAVKLLNNPKLAPIRQSVVKSVAENARHKPSVLPVIVYSERSEILVYLGYRHVTGIKAWSPLAKARCLEI